MGNLCATQGGGSPPSPKPTVKMNLMQNSYSVKPPMPSLHWEGGKRRVLSPGDKVVDQSDAAARARAELVIALGNFIHHLQRERGLSSLLCGESGHGLRAEEDLGPARAAATVAWEDVQGFVEREREGGSGGASRAAGDIAYGLVEDVRDRLDKGSPPLDVFEVLRVYGVVLRSVIDAINTCSAGLRRSPIGAAVQAHVAFLNLKETVGRERAFVGGALSSGLFHQPGLPGPIHLATILGMKEAYVRTFEMAAPGDLLEMFHQTCELPPECAGVEERLLAGAEVAAVAEDVGAGKWFDLLTLMMDRLENIQSALAVDIRKAVDDMRGDLRQRKSEAMVERRDQLRRTFSPGDDDEPPQTPQQSAAGGLRSHSIDEAHPPPPLPQLGAAAAAAAAAAAGGGGAGAASRLSVDLKDIEFGREVGKGSTGSTWLGRWKGTHVAIKVVESDGSPGNMSGAQALKEFEVEAEVLSFMRHPNVCMYLGSAVDPPRYCLVLEYMEGGTVYDLLHKCPDKVDFFSVARGVAGAMQYVHDHCKMMHRDLKTPNLLCDEHGAVKVADFGLGCMEDRANRVVKTGEVGTYRWMAPEVIMHEPYGTEADVYSFGVILWELLTAKLPFHGLAPVKAALAVVVEKHRPTIPREAPKEVADLISACWAADASQRPPFREISRRLDDIEQARGKSARAAVAKCRTRVKGSDQPFSVMGLAELK